MRITAIVPAGGSGTRYSPTKHKLLEKLGGIPVILRTLEAISAVSEISEIIVCTSSSEISNIVKAYTIVPGGKTRQESVFNGLKAVKDSEIVLIHDAARPLVSLQTIRDTIAIAIEKGAAIAAVPTKDTIKKVDSTTGEIIETPDRKELWNIQTPQVFNYELLLKAHEDFKGQEFTDDSALMEKAGHKVFVVKSSYRNIKITTEEDFKFAECL